MALMVLAFLGMCALWGFKLFMAHGMRHWFFRKVIRFGPVNFTLAKSGIGKSIGFLGARIGKSANGRKYLYMRGPLGTYYRRYFK